IIDGSFVTRKEKPNDVDVIIILKDGHDFAAILRPDQYNPLSKKRVKSRFGFDLLGAAPAGPAVQGWIDFFKQVKGRPEIRKGLLRLTL
ncbi:MAG: hypothetical protein HY319_00275, partial [Armatimonadetes bacterium]|nr:hypothetical protein [Armatimonadota bacterium]